jgi:hypothetical protein
MGSLLLSLRMSPQMLADLKALAEQESIKRGESVSWTKLVREGAARMLEEAKRAARGQTRTVPRCDDPVLQVSYFP